MSHDPEKKDPRAWDPVTRIGRSPIDPALLEGLGDLKIPNQFRDLNPERAVAELSKSVASFRKVLNANLVHDLPSTLTEQQWRRLVDGLTKFTTGLHADLAVMLSSAGIENPDIIAIKEADSIKFSGADLSRIRFFSQVYLMDDRDQYLAITHDGKVEASQYPIAISFLGRNAEDGVQFHPFCFYSFGAFTELVNKRQVGPVILGRLTDGIISLVNQLHRDQKISAEEHVNLDPGCIAKTAKSDGSGSFRVKILGAVYDFKLSLSQSQQLQCSGIQRFGSKSD